MIEQIDKILCEDGKTIMFFAHLADPDDADIVQFELPEDVEPADLGLTADE